MSKKKENKTCVYCLKVGRVTYDHVPPRSLFHPKNPGNLITVPCCENCRETQTQDDEYYRFFIHSGSPNPDRSGADPIFDLILRSVQKQEGRGLRKLIASTFGERDIHTTAGIYLGKIPTITAEGPRIRNVADRIIRGLFFNQFKKPLPLNYAVHSKFVQTKIKSGLLEIIKSLRFVPLTAVGNGDFKYTHAIMDNDPYSTFWVMLYYDGLIVLGWTGDPATRGDVEQTHATNAATHRR